MRADKLLSIVVTVGRDGLLVAGAFLVLADAPSLEAIFHFHRDAGLFGMLGLVFLAGAIHAGIHSQLAPLGKLIQKLLLEDL